MKPTDDVTQSCPNEANHTPAPTGYLPYAAWADRMHRTHKQQKCPGCGLYVIWVPKETVDDD